MEEDNLIHSLKFDIELSSANTYFRSISEVEEYCQEIAIPIIEELIDEYGKKNDDVIESLTIALGDVTKEEFIPKLKQMLKEKLFSMGGGKLSQVDFDGEISQRPSETEFLNHYLTKEIIPWVADVQEFDPVRLITASLDSLLDTREKFEQFVMLLQADINAAARFSHDSDLSDLIRFADALKKEYKDRTLPAIQSIKNLLCLIEHDIALIQQHCIEEPMKGEFNELSESVPAVISRVCSHNAELSWLVTYIDSLNSMSLSEINDIAEKIKNSQLDSRYGNIIRVVVMALLTGENLRTELFNALREKIMKIVVEIQEVKGDDSDIDDSENLNEEIGTGTGALASFEQRMNNALQGLLEDELHHMALVSFQEDTDGSEKEITGRIHVFDAGLILLHPFLSSFFHRVKLTDNHNRFISLEAKCRAAHLLRYMAGSELKQDSFHLSLEKMMCGIPTNALIGDDFKITDWEEEEIVGLFDAVKDHWTPMGKSSIEGIQNTFLKRHGTIEYSDSAWIVRIEGNAFDILLEDLPWEISTIILPWLKELIFVEWQQE